MENSECRLPCCIGMARVDGLGPSKTCWCIRIQTPLGRTPEYVCLFLVGWGAPQLSSHSAVSDSFHAIALSYSLSCTYMELLEGGERAFIPVLSEVRYTPALIHPPHTHLLTHHSGPDTKINQSHAVQSLGDCSLVKVK